MFYLTTERLQDLVFVANLCAEVPRSTSSQVEPDQTLNWPREIKTRNRNSSCSFANLDSFIKAGCFDLFQWKKRKLKFIDIKITEGKRTYLQS